LSFEIWDGGSIYGTIWRSFNDVLTLNNLSTEKIDRLYNNNKIGVDRYIICDFSEKNTPSDISHISSFIANVVSFNKHALRYINFLFLRLQ